MIKKTLICGYNVGGRCTYPGVADPFAGPDGKYEVNEGGCRARSCTGYMSPYNAKVQYPLAQIEVAPTPLTVPSLGPDIEYYVYDNRKAPDWDPTEKRYPTTGNSAVINLLSEWYDRGNYPSMLWMDQSRNEKWACKITGKFQAQATAVHRFYIAGDGHVTLTVGAISIGGNITKESGEWLATSSGASALTSGNWYDFNFEYYQKRSQQSGYTILYDYTGSNGKMPVSAGVCVGSGHTLTNGVQFPVDLDYAKIPGIDNISIRASEGEGVSLDFTLPMSVSTGYAGYYYDQDNDRLQCVTPAYNTRTIRKDQLIRLKLGYNTNSYSDLFTVFVGHVTDIKAQMTRNGEKIFAISCNDFTRMVNDAISRNYPTVQTYWLAGMVDVDIWKNGYVVGTPAFDAWDVASAYRALLAHAGVDPILFSKKYEVINYSGAQSLCDEFLISPVSGVNKFPSIKFERSMNYGNPQSAVYGGRPDSEYNFKFGFGERIPDIITPMAENFGLRFGFRGYSEGAPYLTAINTPSKYILANNFSYSGSAMVNSGTYFNVNALGGAYAYTITSGSKASITFTGVGADLICPTQKYSSPSTSQLRVTATRMADGVTLRTVDLSLYSEDTRNFFDGIDPYVGYNPTYFKIVSGLPYGVYKISLESLVNTDTTAWNALLVYEREHLTPEYGITVLRSGVAPESYPGNIISYSLEDSSEDVRNDIVVVGKSKGLEINSTNFDMPKYYYVGRGIDIQSVYDPTAFNYIGRYKTGMITSSKITSDERADFMAYSVLRRLREPGKKVSLESQSMPFMEIGDAFLSLDSKTNLTNEARWVTGFETSINREGLKTSVTSVDFPPYNSYITKPDIDISGVNQVTNLTVSNRGGLFVIRRHDVANSILYVTKWNPTTPTGWMAEMSDIVPMTSSVYPNDASPIDFCNCYVLPKNTTSTTPTDENKSYGFVISGHSTGSPYDEWKLHLWGASSQSFRPGDTVLIPYDPYSSEDGQNTEVVIQFDVTKRGKIRVDIIDMDDSYLVATLTGDPSSEDEGKQYWEMLDVGKHTFYWGGRDQYGGFNKSCPSYPFAIRSDIFGAAAVEHGRPEGGMYVSEKAQAGMGTYVGENSGSVDKPLQVLYPLYSRFYVKITIETITGDYINVAPDKTQLIYTRRGIPCYENASTYYHTERFGLWAFERHNHFRTKSGSPSINYDQYITDSDNSKNGLGIKIHDIYKAVPSQAQGMLAGSMHMYIPRFIKYKINVKATRITGVRIQRKVYSPNSPQGSPDYVYYVWAGDAGTVDVSEGAAQLPLNSSGIPSSSFMGYIRSGNVYKQVYFSPSRDAHFDYRTHAGVLPADRSWPSSDSYEFWGWLLDVGVTLQDLSGRQSVSQEYFGWIAKDLLQGTNTWMGENIVGLTTQIDGASGPYVIGKNGVAGMQPIHEEGTENYGYAEFMVDHDDWLNWDDSQRSVFAGRVKAQVIAI